VDKRVNILIVDDRPENLVALENLLDEPGWRVIKADSGNEALQLLLEHDVALALLDVQMPDMNGFETAELMRANARTRGIPIIFVTAISREQKYVFKGYESGAVDYISKPIEPTILKSKVRVFADLARQRQELEESRKTLAALNRELAEKNRVLQEELDLARKVQLGFLPTSFPRTDRITFGKYYLICTTLGGDLFDAFSIDDRHVGLYMADVAGHGVSAALISGLVKMGFESMKGRAGTGGGTSELLYPERVLRELNGVLYSKIPQDTFITLAYGVVDLSSDALALANAGHPTPLRYVASARRSEYCEFPHGPAIGIEEDPEYPRADLKMESRDKLMLYTDGITEAMNPQEEFGEERLLRAFQEFGARPPAEVIEGILGRVEQHRAGSPVSDDCSILVLQLR
jgi:serine phosphatase RsbU (regulator of sigma subunit)